MSQRLINLNDDLKRLRDEGYHVEIHSSYLVMRDVPYVNSHREIQRGTLVSELSLAGDRTTPPQNHVIYFAGEFPCSKDGVKRTQLEHKNREMTLAQGLVVQRSFSHKPEGGYQDHYHKMTTYAAIISHPAEALDPTVTARTFPVIETEEGESVFVYEDTASSRAEIKALTQKLEGETVGIVGLGGTGSYVLDLVAKTPVRAIHLFDGDQYSQHNAFRSPGAATIDDLQEAPQKVQYFKQRYAPMHRHIMTHEEYIDASNVHTLQDLSFVFLCLDRGDAKRLIVEKLEEWGVPFVDTGMGLELREAGLAGILRTTTSTPQQRRHVWEKKLISFSDGDLNNEYARNIQVADLNALNATLAVIKWKKLVGFYDDLEHENHCTYTLDGNQLDNELYIQNGELLGDEAQV